MAQKKSLVVHYSRPSGIGPRAWCNIFFRPVKNQITHNKMKVTCGKCNRLANGGVKQ